MVGMASFLRAATYRLLHYDELAENGQLFGQLRPKFGGRLELVQFLPDVEDERLEAAEGFGLRLAGDIDVCVKERGKVLALVWADENGYGLPERDGSGCERMNPPFV